MSEYCLRIADLNLRIASDGGPLTFDLPACLQKFVSAPQACPSVSLEVCVRDHVEFAPHRVLFERPWAYAVGLAENGDYLIRGWDRTSPYSLVRIDPAFRRGAVLVPASVVHKGRCAYPLQAIDMVLVLNRLALEGDFVIHSAAISDNGAGYLFPGAAGAGKSTLAELWAGEPGVVVLGDDHAILVRRGGRFWVYGGPWHLDPERCSAQGAPLSAVFLLEHGAEHQATRRRSQDAAPQIIANCFLPLYRRDALDAIVGNVGALVGKVPVYSLAFRPDAGVVDTVRTVSAARR